MKRECLTGCAIGLLILLGGCSETPATPPDTSAADLKTIKDGEIAWAGYWAHRDLDKIVSLYADNASVLVPNVPIMNGKDAIRAGLKDMVADKNLLFSSTTSAAEVARSGDLAYTQGTYSLTITDSKTKKPVTEIGKYVTVYKKQADGSWKAIEDINNADAPPAPVVVARAKKSTPAAKKRKRKA
jgi:uncharacterized protein (TIGR02246 family)